MKKQTEGYEGLNTIAAVSSSTLPTKKREVICSGIKYNLAWIHVNDNNLHIIPADFCAAKRIRGKRDIVDDDDEDH